MNKFEIFNETNEKVDIEEEKKLIEYALRHENLNNVEFNVIFVDANTIQEINKKYRNIDKVTDVISFALEDNENITFEFGRLLGDIYICVDKMKEQAKEYGHSLLREQGFLTIHGLLHLLGYDHMTKEEEKIMFTKQELILNDYGLKR
ncbi:MAG: rRNA maturation RNase YbeY [Bacilli bacterium]|nr:rRNA maturation RNase YbeY [Bacilli bacterium]